MITTVLTEIRLCPKHQQKAADAILMVGDPFTFSQKMVSPVGVHVTMCAEGVGSIKGTLRI